jgi:hypothetical protein
VLIRWVPGCSPTGLPEQVVTIRTVARLRAVVMGARRDPTVETYRYWRIREWDDSDDPAACPACGRDYVPGQISDEDCTCGGHRIWRHEGRCADVVIPPRGPGCSPLPFDPEARQVGWRAVR